MELIASALSKLPSTNGRPSAEHRRNSTRPSPIAVALRFVAWRNISAEGSTPATCAALAANISIATPGPKPISSTRSDCCTSSRSTTHAAYRRLVRARITPPSRPSTPLGRPNVRIRMSLPMPIGAQRARGRAGCQNAARGIKSLQ